MEVLKGQLFIFCMNFIGTNGDAVSLKFEVAWVKVWKMGSTKLYRLEKYDADGKVLQHYLKTTEEITAGILSDKNLLDDEVAQF